MENATNLITSALENVTTVFNSAVNMITGNALAMVFIGIGLTKAGIGLFRSVRKKS